MKEKDLAMSMKCVKYMIFVANFMFVLVGFLLLSIGTTIKTIYSDFDHFLVDNYYDASKLVIAVGVIIFFVSLFGCIGALRESVCLVNMYALMLLLVLILEVTACCVALVMRGGLKNTIRRKMIESMKHNDDPYTGYIWNATQYNLECCGIEGPVDWNNNNTNTNILTAVPEWNGTVSYHVPDTCCSDENCVNEQNLYKRGCLAPVFEIVSDCALLLGIGVLSVAFIQVLGVVFAHLLAKSIRCLKTQMEVERVERRQRFYQQSTQDSMKKEKEGPVLYVPSSSEA